MGQILLFLIVLALILFANRYIPIGISSLFGAFIALLFGYVGLGEARDTLLLVANPTITLIFIVIISLSLTANGFFDFFALKFVKLSRGNAKALFFLIILFGAILASFFTNDGAILILTPIVLSKLNYIHMKEKTVIAFLVAACFIADTSSLTFTISNLTNILSVEFYQITFNAFFKQMVFVNIVSVITSFVVLYLFFRKDLPKTFELKDSFSEDQVIKDDSLFYLSLILMPALFITFFVLGSFNIPSAWILLPYTFVILMATLARKRISIKEIIRKTPFNVIFFSLGMYILIYAMKETVIFTLSSEWMGSLQNTSSSLFLFVNGLYVGLLSCIFNNLPAFLFSIFYIENLDMTPQLSTLSSLSSVIGANIGSKISPIGSLATLLWLNILRKHGINISWGYYLKTFTLLTIPTLVITLLSFLLLS